MAVWLCGCGCVTCEVLGLCSCLSLRNSTSLRVPTTEATVALSVLLRRFKFEYRCPNPPKLKSAVILTAQGGMPLYVSRRSPQPTA